MKNERIAAAAAWLKEEKLAGLIAFNDGQNSFLDSNAVYVFSNLRPIGRSAVIIAQDGTSTLLIEPSWDGPRAQKKASNTRIIACDDLARALQDHALLSGAICTNLSHHSFGASLAAFV